MDTLPLPPLALVSIGLLVVAMIGFGVILYWQNHSVWQKFAETHGMEHSGFELRGTWEGHTVEVSTKSLHKRERRNLGPFSDREYTHTHQNVIAVRMELGDVLLSTLALDRKWGDEGMLEVLGLEGVPLNNEPFDSLFSVERLTARTETLLRDEEVDQLLVGLAQEHHDVSLRKGWLQIGFPEQVQTPEDLEFLLERTYEAAQVLLRASERATQYWRRA